MNAVPPAAPHQENLNSGPSITAAQRSNLLPFTARGYSWWRARSLSLLGAGAFPLAREERLFRALCRPVPGELWLDVGTSTGFYAGALARCGARVVAADLSGPMLSEAARREPSPAITWTRMNVEVSGLPDASFDGVTVGATLNETHDPARLLREVARLTRPGGQVWLMYLRRTAGPVQALLGVPALGGLTFPDPGWVQRHLPGLRRTAALGVGAVQFEQFVRGA
ncbi:class I SAM-dependent methyltransferase [Deinococcus taeanensis]|uniref:class I SAM-dependent methyltransferase n=1 Tax=Deinococcus taeanensis TaxID=2737050 RepID=UPI001CDD4D7E|nr:class I SAM-dependent methyltransferase [Deinococcus taeanensis]UBV41608.1 class I SAM-dependent methyltransferase [Deinococcus taeanensis]